MDGTLARMKKLAIFAAAAAAASILTAQPAYADGAVLATCSWAAGSGGCRTPDFAVGGNGDVVVEITGTGRGEAFATPTWYPEPQFPGICQFFFDLDQKPVHRTCNTWNSGNKFAKVRNTTATSSGTLTVRAVS